MRTRSYADSIRRILIALFVCACVRVCLLLVDSDGLRPASESPDGGFWGFHTNEVSVESDPALDDMMAFFGFAHKEKTSEYVGCVSFELTYPDGRTSIKTVNVRPKSDHDNSIRIEEVKSDDPPKSARVEPIPSSVSPHGWLTPVRRLVVPLRPSADSSLSSACDAAPRLPFSSRIDIFTGPLPAHVKPTARLLCPRSIFFDVYLGRLDPMTSVLTGKAHCPGWRYYELLHFGQCFEMKPETWTSFYAAQKIVQDGNKAITDGKNE